MRPRNSHRGIMGMRRSSSAINGTGGDATRELADALTQAHPTMTVTSEALFGHPTDELAGAISDADEGMVVVGSHHPSALVSFFADGVARRLPTLVTCPVVAIPVG